MSPDTRRHRGAHPADRQLFSASQTAVLRTATAELSWLLSRGYAITSSLKLVGDHHGLNKRQRVALSRAACSDQSRAARQATCLPVQQIADQKLVIDGFNLLITLEAALSGGVILLCRDGCVRDIASVHGSYRTVLETPDALELIGKGLAAISPKSVLWLFDKPVSNSGRLAQLVRTTAQEHAWPWQAEVTLNPDTVIAASAQIAVSSDSSVLDQVLRWVNLSAYLIEHYISEAWVIDLRGEPSCC
ncbi:DUF434 domain-containing protein [candidate division KSB3 bacterium]|uniref:DUF434 domain-containing protein n=1 Tax=candidate division KSB3 bacterium TaxID=2044937 RepID=A0A9D5Q8H4_9BACT|nr:DUF434 domain-containing protein [candidate division KSB3 bacterium]MBD3326881.1 DUF434 domain-containing protein [candidate division KSB3 bacterium]